MANLRWADLSWANLSEANLRGADLRWADLSWANLSGANLRWADLSAANLSGANLSWANLRGANLSGADLPSPTMVLLASWGECSDELTRDLMRYDAACHADPEAFDRWAAAGPCPYSDQRYQRAARFRERKEVWSPGPCPRPFDLMVRVLRERCKDSDYHEHGKEPTP
jgi:hypothetical protein